MAPKVFAEATRSGPLDDRIVPSTTDVQHDPIESLSVPDNAGARSSTEALQPSQKVAIDGPSLLSELVAVFQHHLALPKGAADALALWVLFTHCFDVAEVSPRLALNSPLPECGKPAVLSILSYWVRKSLLVSNVTLPAIFRVIERDHPTLLLDEADTYIEGRDDFRGILNSGHTPASAWVLRTTGDNYEPIAIAKIGELPDTLAGRAIIIPMRRNQSEEKVERFRPNVHGSMT